VCEEPLPALALQARPNEQAGQKKHELHQIEKLKCAKKIEAEPTLVIDNRENPPIVGRQVEGRRCRGLRDDIGGKRMEGDDEEQQNAPQILERQAGFRHFPNTPEQAVRAADGDDNTTCRKIREQVRGVGGKDAFVRIFPQRVGQCDLGCAMFLSEMRSSGLAMH
jgi:hypothetical protein